ncbi:MAG TPA: ADYC domain-containing protein [Geminicoccaceae bacterium]
MMTFPDGLTGTVVAAAALLNAPAVVQAPAEAAKVAALALVDRTLIAVMDDGSIRAEEALIGAEAPLGGGRRLRIDGVVQAYDRLPRPLYDVSVRASPDAPWRTLCPPDRSGRTTAIPIPGRWGADGGFELVAAPGFSLSCTASVEARCVRLGYAPWQLAPDGSSLEPYHQACVHMVQADYCGDGEAGPAREVAFEVFDRAGINPVDGEGDPAGTPEALWGPEGAVCVARARHPGVPLDEQLRACPGLAGPPAADCSAADLDDFPAALLGSRS